MKARFYTDKQKMKLIKLYYFIQDILEGGFWKFSPSQTHGFVQTEILHSWRKKTNKNRLHDEEQWFCNICNNNKDYKLAGKHTHLRTKKTLTKMHLLTTQGTFMTKKKTHKNMTLNITYMETPKKRGPPRVFTDKEIQQRKNDYGRNTPWFCEICNNNKNYAMRGKTCSSQNRKAQTACFNLQSEKRKTIKPFNSSNHSLSGWLS